MRILRESAVEWAAVAIVSLAAGALVGWWGEGFLREASRAEPPEPLPPPAVEAASPTESPRAQRERERLRRRLYADWMETLAEMGMRVVPETTFEHLAMSPLDSDGRVSDDVRELFLLTGEEAERLDAVIADAEARLLEAEMEHLEYVFFSDEQAVFLVPAFEEGPGIEAALREGIMRELGEEDGRLFWDLLHKPVVGTRSATDRWKGFGRVDREIVFSVRDHEPGMDGGEDVAFWLHYEERVSPEDAARVFRDDGLQVGSISRMAPVRLGDPAAMDPVAGLAGPVRGRYEYLVPHLPDELRGYFAR